MTVPRRLVPVLVIAAGVLGVLAGTRAWAWFAGG
jgi:hypothetical protein